MCWNARGSIIVQHNFSHDSVEWVHAPVGVLSGYVCGVLTGYLQVVEIPKNQLLFAAASVHHKEISCQNSFSSD